MEACAQRAAQLDPAGKKKLWQEADTFNQTVRSQCGSGAVNSGKTASPTAIPCVKQHFLAQRGLLAGRLTGAAAEEAARPLRAHVAASDKCKPTASNCANARGVD
jgi:hypothetical protein